MRITRRLTTIFLMLMAYAVAAKVSFAAPTINSVDMQIGDTLRVTCPGSLSYTGGLLRCTQGVELPTLTPTSSPTSVVTPTILPTSSPTSTPTATATLTNVAAYAGAPLCAEHDSSLWHNLWNAQLGCHYDHEHGVSPNAMASYVISGTNITYGNIENYDGVQLGYLWQTTGENQMKHRLSRSIGAGSSVRTAELPVHGSESA